MINTKEQEVAIASDICSGNLKALMDYESTEDVHILDVTKFLGFKNYKKIYQMDSLALIILGEGKHPHQFLKYKEMIDFLLRKKGYNELLYCFTFTEYDFAGTKETKDLRETLPFSENMMRYLIFLDEHNDDKRKEIVDLLKNMDRQKKYATLIEKQKIQRAKRLFAKIYRREYPKKMAEKFLKDKSLLQHLGKRMELD